MASLKDLLVTGPARIIGKVFSTDGFSGDGAELTNLNGSNIASGTVPYARLPVGTGTSQIAQGNHTHTTTLATDTGTSTITLASAEKYKLTAGDTSVVFTMPTIPTVSYPVTSVNTKTGAVVLDASDVGAAENSKSIEYIIGTQTEATGSWTGVTQDSELYVGKTIAYKLPYDGSGNASLQLKDSNNNNIGDNIAVYSMTTRVTTQYPAGSIIHMTYDGTCWRTTGWYNTNTNTIGYQLRTNSTAMKTAIRSRYYRLFFTSADGTYWEPANTGYDNSATSSKTVNTRPIDPFGRIVYTSANTNYTAESVVAATTIWDRYAINLGYSFNKTGAALTLTYPAPVYVKCAPQADGSAIIDSTTPIVQALPSTADNKIYIFLGVAYSATNIELVDWHPVYYHNGTGIRLWTGGSNTVTVSGTKLIITT